MVFERIDMNIALIGYGKMGKEIEASEDTPSSDASRPDHPFHCPQIPTSALHPSIAPLTFPKAVN
jgi:hypothetical protein